MSKDLIIVESPAKVKTIKKFLGQSFNVQASVGHIRDLPPKEIGVDEEHGFLPKYVTISGKEKVVNGLREAAAKADTVYLAPDPDREGEAIAWHIAESIKDKNTNIKRIQFNEITARAVKEAIANPRQIDTHLFDAQQARRVLDRLVGYKISPLLWKSIKRGISAGRVQSVALRLIVEREEERQAFMPEEYWVFKALLEADAPPPFKADLVKVKGKKPSLPDETAALAVEKSMEGQPFVVKSVEEKERSRDPLPPFITSTLQQAANQRIGFSAKRTMTCAQRLYEGLELGEAGTTALITYMRTDSVRIADEAREATALYIEKNHGPEYLPPAMKGGGKGRVFKGKNSAQDAHEAIRPVDINITPASVREYLDPDQFRLYNLIWSRFVASQMAAARFHDTNVLITCGPTEWKSKGERMLFPGFFVVMPKSAEEEDSTLPPLAASQILRLASLSKEQKFTQPSPRYTEASLVRELEERGIGRPSTYAAIISTIQDREYVRVEDKHFTPTDLGNVVVQQLREHFANLMDIGFTASMEDNLDKVAEGALSFEHLLKDFTKDFNPALDAAAKNMKAVKGGMQTNLACPECGKPLAVKFGKAGEFLACSGYPECRYTSNFTRDEKGAIQIQEKQVPVRQVMGTCPVCGADVVLKQSRTGSRFLSCSRYPECTHAAPYPTGVACPKCANGKLVEKSSKRGKIFYACDQYPQCDYAIWDLPLPTPCPKCHNPFMLQKYSKAKGKYIVCPECKYEAETGE